MSFLLDTNICSAHFRRPAGLAHRFMQYSGGLFIPTIVLGEPFAWAYRRPPLPSLLATSLLSQDCDTILSVQFVYERIEEVDHADAV